MLALRRVFSARRQPPALAWVSGGEKEGALPRRAESGRTSPPRGATLGGNRLREGRPPPGGAVAPGAGGAGQVPASEAGRRVPASHQQLGVAPTLPPWFWFPDALWDSHPPLLEFTLEGGGVVGSDSVSRLTGKWQANLMKSSGCDLQSSGGGPCNEPYCLGANPRLLSVAHLLPPSRSSGLDWYFFSP